MESIFKFIYDIALEGTHKNDEMFVLAFGTKPVQTCDFISLLIEIEKLNNESKSDIYEDEESKYNLDIYK